MIGVEINFINTEHDVNHTVDVEGPIFDLSEIKNRLLEDCKSYLSEPHTSIEITYNEYLGTNDDGYDFNNCYSRIVCTSIEEVKSNLTALLPNNKNKKASV